MRPTPLRLSMLVLAAALASAAVDAQSAPPGWRVFLPSGSDGERLYLDAGSPIGDLVTVRESGRMPIDVPSLDEWLRRRMQSDSVPGGGRWTDSGTRMGKNDATTAMFTRTFVWRRGVTGVVQYGAATGNGREGRVLRATFGTQAAMDGPRGQIARTLFMDRMLAEVTSGLNAAASPAPTPPARSAQPAPRAPAPAPPASAADAPAASVAPAGWRESQDPLNPGARLFIEVGEPPAAMWQIREFPRAIIDAPSLGEWLTRQVRAAPPPPGTQWADAGQMIEAPTVVAAAFSRATLAPAGGRGLVVFAVASGDGKQARMIQVQHPTRESLEGRRGVAASELRGALQLAEAAETRAAQQLAERAAGRAAQQLAERAAERAAQRAQSSNAKFTNIPK